MFDHNEQRNFEFWGKKMYPDGLHIQEGHSSLLDFIDWLCVN